MTTREQRLISDVLQHAHLTKMPKQSNEDIWIEAVAKIRLSNNSIGYGIIKRNADLSYRVCYINGDTAAIVELEEVYPYIKLDKRTIQKFKETDAEKERIAYLRSTKIPYLEKMDLESMTIDELNKEVVKAAVYQQLKALDE